MPWMRQVRIGGFGGQGVVLAGLILGEAGVRDGRYVTGSNSYGAQARGSGCKSEVVLSDGPIDFPHVITADILVAMSQAAYDRYIGEVAPGGLVIYDAPQVAQRSGVEAEQLGAAATETALRKLKNKQAANMVLLGTLVAVSDIVSAHAIGEAIERHTDARFRAANMEAFRLGIDLGRQARG